MDEKTIACYRADEIKKNYVVLLNGDVVTNVLAFDTMRRFVILEGDVTVELKNKEKK